MPKRIHPYEQTLTDSCLTCCLLMMARYYGKGVKITKKLELAILTKGLKFDKKSYDIGQLHAIARRYGMSLDYFIESLDAFHYARKLPFSKRIVIHNRNIDADLIKEKLENGPVIISLDPFGLMDDSHYSHYILITGKKRHLLTVMDPWTGEGKQVEQKALSLGIRRLRALGFSPVLIAKRSGRLSN